jgi:hypothetical protein
VVDEIEIHVAVQFPGTVEGLPLPGVVVEMQPCGTSALQSTDPPVQVQATEVNTFPRRLMDEKVLQHRDAVLAGEHPDVVALGHSQHHAQTNFLLRSLAGLTRVRRQQHLHRARLASRVARLISMHENPRAGKADFRPRHTTAGTAGSLARDLTLGPPTR